MFFDDQDDNKEYEGLLLAYAKKCKEVLQCEIHLKSRKLVPKQKGFLGFGKKKDTRKEELLAQLELAKRNIVEYRKKQGYGTGVFWWSLPWENIERYLTYDLYRKEDFDNWRFAYQNIVEGKDQFYVLGLLEEGHCSMFSASSHYEHGIISDYSVGEINEKMRDFNTALNCYDLYRLATVEGSVHSTVSGADYDSMAHYLLSCEHFVLRDYANDVYAKSLYTEHETQVVTAHSQSSHYKKIMAVGEYHVDFAGKVDHIKTWDYKVLDKQGYEYDEEFYESRDAAVELAMWLSEAAEVKSVPMELFGNRIEDSNSDFNNALRQAELIICLADKLC